MARPATIMAKVDLVVPRAFKAATVRLGQAEDLEEVAVVELRIPLAGFQFRGHVAEFE